MIIFLPMIRKQFYYLNIFNLELFRNLLIGQTKGIRTNNSLKTIPKTRSRRKMNLYFLNLIYSPQFNKYKPLVHIAQLQEKKN